MKKIILILTILILLSNNTFSQVKKYEIPDYKLIKKNIEDKSSNYYYPKLLERMTSNDSLLNNEDYRHLYFGYVFNQKYSSYFRSPDEEKLKKYYQSDKINEKDYNEIIKLAEHSISLFPFDLRQMNFLAYIYHLKGDEISAKNISNRFHKIIEAIISSGNGEKCETGFHVISVSHEYVLLNLFELQNNSQSLVGNCDYMAFEKGKYKIDGMYFSIEKILENEMKPFDGK
ncbi:DUF4919 domain-containing protein [Flavobacterium branchiophilum]|uniref:DUF4919 domain-containing protein n=1 Tax=Flavobacterium branchiophilum (strain FL-15) TaxID=1034807 RepID=G2Z6Y8_FLABF|nr:DUF4919 domain-containing protein [Flavobacterium branchiophilum]CCB68988.1 Protein of unknown function precursor [Flavobacterium branchiophilum FL-15]